MIYFTSDLHLCHNNESVYKQRGFESIDDMNETIIMNYCKTINDNDTVYFLGDLISHDNELALQMLSLLPGKKRLILGNHDTPRRIKLYHQSNIFEDIKYADIIFNKEYAFYLSHFPTKCTVFQSGRYFVSLCGHEHSSDKFLNWKTMQYIYQCEVDAHNFYPVSLEQILKDIKLKRGK